MRKTAFLIATLFLFSGKLLAQLAIEVPSQIRFADMRLNLTSEARKKIQTDVDALIRHEKYFNAKVKKVDAHLPIIEQVLREENVPDDIKYLVIQESALVGDAVSTSNAVGYWQFKEATGREVGLTINREVDERMNIVTATRGPADSEVETVCEATRRIKEEWPLDVCASLGILKDGQAERLCDLRFEHLPGGHVGGGQPRIRTGRDQEHTVPVGLLLPHRLAQAPGQFADRVGRGLHVARRAALRVVGAFDDDLPVNRG